MFKKKKTKTPPSKGEETEVTEAATKPEKEEEAKEQQPQLVLNLFEAGVYDRFNYIASILQEIKEEQENIKEMIEKEINQ